MKLIYKIVLLTMVLTIITNFSACKKISETSIPDISTVSEKPNLNAREYSSADNANTISSSNSGLNNNMSGNSQMNNSSSKTQTGTSSNSTKPSNSNSSKSTASSKNPSNSTTSPVTPQNPDENQTPADNQKLTTLTASEIKEMESYFLELVNAERQRVGVQPLERNDTLDKAAKIRVEETFVKMGHTRPDGTDCFTVLDEFKYGTPVENIWSEDGENWHTDIIYDYGVAGENLAGDYNSDRRDIKMITKGFFTNLKNSSGHYQNMIGKSFNKTGIAISSIIDDNLLKCHILQIFTEK